MGDTTNNVVSTRADLHNRLLDGHGQKLQALELGLAAHVEALEKAHKTLYETMPSRLDALESRSWDTEVSSQRLTQSLEKHQDDQAKSKHLLESRNSNFRLYLTAEGDVTVWRRSCSGQGSTPRTREDDGEFRLLCWQAGIGGRAPQCSVNRELTARETDRVVTARETGRVRETDRVCVLPTIAAS